MSTSAAATISADMLVWMSWAAQTGTEGPTTSRTRLRMWPSASSRPSAAIDPCSSRRTPSISPAARRPSRSSSRISSEEGPGRGRARMGLGVDRGHQLEAVGLGALDEAAHGAVGAAEGADQLVAAQVAEAGLVAVAVGGHRREGARLVADGAGGDAHGGSSSRSIGPWPEAGRELRRRRGLRAAAPIRQREKGCLIRPHPAGDAWVSVGPRADQHRRRETAGVLLQTPGPAAETVAGDPVAAVKRFQSPLLSAASTAQGDGIADPQVGAYALPGARIAHHVEHRERQLDARHLFIQVQSTHPVDELRRVPPLAHSTGVADREAILGEGKHLDSLRRGRVRGHLLRSPPRS